MERVKYSTAEYIEPDHSKKKRKGELRFFMEEKIVDQKL